jgi:hypothetical protein
LVSFKKPTKQACNPDFRFKSLFFVEFLYRQPTPRSGPWSGTSSHWFASFLPAFFEVLPVFYKLAASHPPLFIYPSVAGWQIRKIPIDVEGALAARACGYPVDYVATPKQVTTLRRRLKRAAKGRRVAHVSAKALDFGTEPALKQAAR